ncbi:uncharacterized protein C2845_PM11G04350 [Panicum miliaceum]|uniref:Uncharacterized protein n=1 Tax=Panicum miliaceum TaxID=4540 RepID=A0A3L6RVF8_PANMI|nr:uncharacterized protein C2845_PM11G04350 [Panicum miliaceum]
MTHPWRKNKFLFDGTIEMHEAPGKFTAEEVAELPERVSNVSPGLRNNAPKKRKSGEDGERVIYNCKAGWWKLPYWKFLLLPHNLDVMHTEKNICDNLIGTLLKLQWKTKDTLNARLDLADMSIRSHLQPYQDGNVVKIPHASYVLKPAQRNAFCNFL